MSLLFIAIFTNSVFVCLLHCPANRAREMQHSVLLFVSRGEDIKRINFAKGSCFSNQHPLSIHTGVPPGQSVLKTTLFKTKLEKKNWIAICIHALPPPLSNRKLKLTFPVANPGEGFRGPGPHLSFSEITHFL